MHPLESRKINQVLGELNRRGSVPAFSDVCLRVYRCKILLAPIEAVVVSGG
jgi:hypothetical protein